MGDGLISRNLQPESELLPVDLGPEEPWEEVPAPRPGRCKLCACRVPPCH